MNIGIIGWWKHGNEGDRAILRSVHRALAPYHSIVAIDLPFALGRDALRRLNQLDFLILGGGGLFLEAPPQPFDTFKAWTHMLETPFGVMGVGIDKLSDHHADAVSRLVDRARFFYVRDSVSQRLIGHPRVRIAPDITFLDPMRPTPSVSAASLGEPLCGVNMRQVRGIPVQEWLDSLRALPVRLRGIPLATYDAWQESRILREIDPTCPAAFDPALYTGLDFLIGVAFHSVVFAVQCAVPVIAIAYAPKVRRFMDDNGLAQYVLDPEQWTDLPQMVRRLLAERVQLVRRLGYVSAGLCSAAQNMIADVRQQIDLVQPRAPSRAASKVSVVVVGPPRSDLTRATIASCLDQTHGNVEILVSADETNGAGDLAQLAQREDRVSVIPGRACEGLGACLNRAIACATGEYVTWVLAGDTYAQDAIAYLVEYMEREPACEVAYTDYYLMHDGDRIADIYPVEVSWKLVRANIVGPCFMVRRSLAHTLGSLRTDTPLTDYDYWLRAHQVAPLHSLHVAVFYCLACNRAPADVHAMRDVRRKWRRLLPLPLRLLGDFADTEFTERHVVRPLARAIRATRSIRHRARVALQTTGRELGRLYRSGRTLMLRTDVGRWRHVIRETTGWDGRNRLIASLIPANSSVLDIGSGAQTLRQYLPPGCKYQPCDVIKTSEDVLLCDFNAGAYPAVTEPYDYAVCSGVLEYARQPEAFLRVVPTLARQAIISYTPLQEKDSKLDRLANGWVNHLSRAELERLFDALSLSWTVLALWRAQVVYCISGHEEK